MLPGLEEMDVILVPLPMHDKLILSLETQGIGFFRKRKALKHQVFHRGTSQPLRHVGWEPYYLMPPAASAVPL